jgi:hypothetical protein
MKGPPVHSRAARAFRLAWDHLRSIPLARRSRADLSEVRETCLFVGAPKTGHSLVGSLLDAHPRMAVAHESDVLLQLRAGFRRRQILALLLENTVRHAARGRRESGYDYVVPGQWQGRWQTLRVIGDKHAEGTALRLRLFPGLWSRLDRELAGTRFIHVVRNPFDAIASLTRPARRRLDVGSATDYYFFLVSEIPVLRERVGEERFLEVRHEDLVAAPAETLASVCGFLGEEAPADYLAACAAIVFETPRRARAEVTWTPTEVREVERRAAHLPFLRDYSFPT